MELRWKPRHLVTISTPVDVSDFSATQAQEFNLEISCVKIVDDAIYRMIGSKYSQDNDLLPKNGDCY